MSRKIASLLAGAYFLILSAITFAQTKCPELMVTSLKVTSINTYVNFTFSLKNTGTDSVLLSNIVLQTYVAYDSSLTSSVIKPSGGSILSYIRSGYLNPDSTLSSEYSVSPPVSIDSLSYLVTDFYLVNVTECTSDKNVAITKMKVATQSAVLRNSYQKISWNAETQALYFNSYSSGYYSIYGVNGIKMLNGKLTGNQYINLNLEKGLYFVELVSDNRRIVKKFRVD